MNDYATFLETKRQLGGRHGFAPDQLPDWLFDFQRSLVAWALEQGRAAIFADCGTGKSPMQLAWAEAIREKTGRPVLIITPLAVSFQTEREAAKFGIDAQVSRDGTLPAGITITNYERLERFDPTALGGVVCDESSAIKSFDGQRRAIVTEFLRTLPYRLLCTATAAPNDYVELGTSSEALGELGYMDMLGRFFTNSMRTSAGYHGKWRMNDAHEWRFKGHAEQEFWRWVASWARAMRRPSDLGYPDDGFNLPPLETRSHVIEARTPQEGTLFDVPANGLREERNENRRTIVERCEKAAELATEHKVSILWCHLNAEGDLLERLTPQSIQVRGPDSGEYKEAAARWFTGDLCICDHPLFRAKLATWRGNQSTQQLDALVTRLTQRNENDDAAKGETQKPIANICASTTPETRNDSNEPPNNEPNATNVADNDTPTIPNTENAQRRQHVTSTQQPGAINDYERNTGLVQQSLMQSSRTKTTGVQSAGHQSVTAPDGDSASTTVTKQARSGGSSAAPAILDSVNSETTLIAYSEPSCICGHISGERRLITKPVMFGLGLNFQHCAHAVYFPSHSYEQYYQAIRRMWRFGQKRPVTVDIITTPGGVNVMRNLERKGSQADRMFTALVSHMRDAINVQTNTTYDRRVEVPPWLA